MTNAAVLKHVEDAVTAYGDDQQLDAALNEKIAKYDSHLLQICCLQLTHILLTQNVCSCHTHHIGSIQCAQFASCTTGFIHPAGS